VNPPLRFANNVAMAFNAKIDELFIFGDEREAADTR
jgi:DNA-binding XRE family transcriptional regulator